MKPLALLALALLVLPAPALAQAQQGEPPQIIDILVRPADPDAPLENCSDEQEAASISGEIVVCRRKSDGSEYGFDKKAAERRHAERTQGQKPLDLFGIPDHGIVVARGCFIPPCPKPMPILIDIEALPEAPPGSDADRMARGLPPLGRDRRATAEAVSAQPQANAGELGLPPAPQNSGPISPSGSASPAEEPSG